MRSSRSPAEEKARAKLRHPSSSLRMRSLAVGSAEDVSTSCQPCTIPRSAARVSSSVGVPCAMLGVVKGAVQGDGTSMGASDMERRKRRAMRPVPISPSDRSGVESGSGKARAPQSGSGISNISISLLQSAPVILRHLIKRDICATPSLATSDDSKDVQGMYKSKRANTSGVIDCDLEWDPTHLNSCTSA